MAFGLPATSPLASAQVTNVRVNDDSGTAAQTYPSIAQDAAGRTYAAWIDDRSGDEDIYFASSSDNGRTWSTNVRVNDDGGGARQWFPRVAASLSGEVLVVWTDHRNSPSLGEVFLARSGNGGAAWGSNLRLSDSAPNGANTARVAFAGVNGAHVVWVTGDGVSLASSTDGGVTWSAARTLAALGADAEQPALAADASGALVLAWVRRQPGEEGLYYSKSVDGGLTWTASVLVFSGVPHNPAIATDASSVYMAWEDPRNGNYYDIYTTASPDGGQSWTGPLVRVNPDVDPGTDYHQFPSLAVDGAGTVYAGWTGWGESFATRGVFFARSTDRGATWEDFRVDGGAETARKYASAMTVTPEGTVLTVWGDERNDNGDIYFAAGGEEQGGNGGVPVFWWLLFAVLVATVIVAVGWWRRRRRGEGRSPDRST